MTNDERFEIIRADLAKNHPHLERDGLLDICAEEELAEVLAMDAEFLAEAEHYTP